MTEAELREQMEAAAAREDFEEARRFRDHISLLRGGAVDADTIDTAGLERQQPGRMGLGSSQQRVTPLDGWTPPKKPDSMINRSSRTRATRSSS